MDNTIFPNERGIKIRVNNNTTNDIGNQCVRSKPIIHGNQWEIKNDLLYINLNRDVDTASADGQTPLYQLPPLIIKFLLYDDDNFLVHEEYLAVDTLRLIHTLSVRMNKVDQ